MGSRIKSYGFAYNSTYTFRPALPSAGLLNSKRPSVAHNSWHWNINQFSIAYPFRTLLRTRLTLRWRASRRKPWVYGVNDSHINYRYSCLHAHLHPLQYSLPVYLRRWMQRSPTTVSMTIYTFYGLLFLSYTSLDFISASVITNIGNSLASLKSASSKTKIVRLYSSYQ